MLTAIEEDFLYLFAVGDIQEDSDAITARGR